MSDPIPVYSHEQHDPIGYIGDTHRCTCGRTLPASFRFCDACGRPVAYTGATQRLEERRPHGILRGELIYEPTSEQLCDVEYVPMLDWKIHP